MDTRKFNIVQDNSFLYYRRILEILGAIPPVSNLMPSEKDLLAHIMVARSEHPNLTENEKTLLIFSKDGKDKLGVKVGYKRQGVENMLSSLRKKGVLNDSSTDEPNTVIKSLRFDGKEVAINFVFKIM